MKKTTRRGFTLVELTVVMAIVAILSLIGVAVLVNFKNSSAADGATQQIVSTIREAQNKALSVANAPGSSSSADIPVAWGVTLNTTNNTLQPFYIKPDLTTRETLSLQAIPLSLVTVATDGPTDFAFSAPFGKYYAGYDFSAVWSKNPYRPYDAIPSNGNSDEVNLTVSYKNVSRTIVISESGDVYAAQ